MNDRLPRKNVAGQIYLASANQTPAFYLASTSHQFKNRLGSETPNIQRICAAHLRRVLITPELDCWPPAASTFEICHPRQSLERHLTQPIGWTTRTVGGKTNRKGRGGARECCSLLQLAFSSSECSCNQRPRHHPVGGLCM